MRVGDILLKHGWVDWEALALALAEQQASGIRLCSLLVAQGAVAFDHASRALGERHGTAAVLRRHLERRDHSCAALLPAQIATERVALPIGRLGNGALIVCVRDPSPALHAELSKLLDSDLVLAIAPARYLERLVEDTYVPNLDDEVEDDLDAELDQLLAETEPDEARALELDIDVEEPAAASDDFAIDVEVPAPAPQRAPTKPLPVQFKPVVTRATTLPARDSLDAAIGSFADIDDEDWLFDVVMEYLTSQWTASLLLAIRETRVVGVRGHGRRLKPAAVRTFVSEVGDAALLQLACAERRIVEHELADPGPDHEQLVTALETRVPIAAPIVRRDSVSHVLVVGEPLAGDREDAVVDLGLLTEAMGEALAKM